MEELPGLTGGAADVDPQSQAAVAVVVGGRGCRERENTEKPSSLRASHRLRRRPESAAEHRLKRSSGPSSAERPESRSSEATRGPQLEAGVCLQLLPPAFISP